MGRTTEATTPVENLTSQQTTYSITTSSSISSSTTSATYNPDICNSTSQVALLNGTCVSNTAGQQTAVNTINNASATSTDKANALSLYFQATAN
jgi:Tfp pilus assembly protein FimT